ncbi:phage tail sheath C-terminal domain-containing protein [Clostridium neuense]
MKAFHIWTVYKLIRKGDSMGLPVINITFKRLANDAEQKSQRGIVALIIKDDTDKTFTTKEYKNLDDLSTDEKLYTASNLQYIKDCLKGSPGKVIVIRINATDGNIQDAFTIIKSMKINWLGCAEGVQADQDAICTFVKDQEELKKTYKAVVFKPTTPPDCKQIVVLGNEKVTFKDNARGQVTGEKYISRLLGILAGLPLSMSSTYYVLDDLATIVEPTNINTSIDSGNLIIINDDGVIRIGRGVTSLTTITDDDTEDMKKIAVVEAINIMQEDITTTFKSNYVGKYKNSPDNQVIFISGINDYYKTLAQNDILDADYTNTCDIDIEAQRQAWIKAGNSEATTWKDADVRKNTFKSNVFIKANVKVLDAMEDMDFTTILE